MLIKIIHKKIELRNYKNLFKHTIFTLSLFLGYILQTYFNIIFITAIIVSISMLQNISTSCVYSLFGGILCDISMNTPIGFNCCIFIVTCSIISILTLHYFKTNLLSFSLFTFATFIITYTFIILFKYRYLNFYELNILIFKSILPSIIISVVISLFIFLFFSYINSKLINLEL